jgi:hypothetical protein
VIVEKPQKAVGGVYLSLLRLRGLMQRGGDLGAGPAGGRDSFPPARPPALSLHPYTHSPVVSRSPSLSFSLPLFLPPSLSRFLAFSLPPFRPPSLPLNFAPVLECVHILRLRGHVSCESRELLRQLQFRFTCSVSIQSSGCMSYLVPG